MSNAVFPTDFSALSANRTISVLADNGTSNGYVTIGAIVGRILLTDLPAGGADAGDFLSWDGTYWTPTVAPVLSVAGRNGAVTLAASDIQGLTPLATTTVGAGLAITSGVLAVQVGTTAGTLASGNDTRITGAQQASEKGVAGGYPSLDGSAKIPLSQLPAAIAGALSYQGTWNAATNTPVLANGVGTKGYFYTVTTTGSTSLDGYNVWNIGDKAVFNGTTWEKLDGTPNEVISVAGRSGAVVLASADVSGLASSATIDTTNASNISSGVLPVARLPLATTGVAGAVQIGVGLSVTTGTVSANVTTVAGRAGAVALATTDISGLGSIATQAASAVTLTGGTINGVTIGSTVAAAGRFTGVTVNPSVLRGDMLTLNDGGSRTYRVFSSTTNELYVENDEPGRNTVVLRNKNTGGYSALVTDGLDASFPSTAQNALGYYQHATFGYGTNLALNGRPGLGFIESARFDGQWAPGTTDNATPWPLQFTIQQTGGAFLAPTFDVAAAAQGSYTVTRWAGGNWPAGIDGQVWREQGDGGFWASGTRIVSGAGTATLTLSNPAMAGNGYIPVMFGALTYNQFNAMVFRDLTSIDFYGWSTAQYAVTPFMRLDRNQSRVGIGALGNSIYPQAALDVIGNVVVGSTLTGERLASWATYPINIITTGVAMQKWLKSGVNTLLWVWNASPSRLDLFEANASVTSMSWLMDGSARVSVNQNNPNAAAQFQVDSTTRGFLPPRVTTTQRNAIVAPPAGLEVFDSTIAAKYVYTGLAWAKVIAGTIDGLPIGFTTPSTGAFTTLSAIADVSMGVSLQISSFGGTYVHRWNHASNGEFIVSSNISGLSGLTVENLNINGLAGIGFRTVDQVYPSTNQNANGSYYHGGIGFCANLNRHNRLGIAYWDIARSNGLSDPDIPPPQMVIMQTGGAWITPPTQDVISVTLGSYTVTKWAGGNFPAGIDGQLIRDQANYGFLSPGTKIVSGAGTSTLTLNKPTIGSTNGYIPVYYGVTSYGQSDVAVLREMGDWDFYSWANSRSNSNTPFFKLARLQGRVGIGSLINATVPIHALDVIGQAVFGTSAGVFDRSTTYANGVINIIDAGTRMFEIYKTGVNTFKLNWNASPSRLDFTDLNGAVSPLTLLMDGTARVSVNQTSPNAAAQVQIDSITRGFLLPRMTTTQKNAITSPPEGLEVYDLTLHKKCVYTGSAWETLTSA